MRRSMEKSRGFVSAVIALGLGITGLAAVRPAAAQDCTGIAPYVFILFDTSGSMNWAPPCSQTEVDAGFCAWRCDQYDCWVSQMGDSPSSKFFQVKQALYDVVSNTSGVQFGFATLNQDTLKVSSKHWTYEAAGSGVNIPGWGAYPSIGTRETFGATWNCNSGSGNGQVGCSASAPADLSDAWKRTRVQQLSKLGTNFNQNQIFYVRVGTLIYRVTYAPAAGATPGSPVNVTETVVKCNNVACSVTSAVGSAVVPFNPVGDFLVWEDGGSPLSQTNPQLNYFSATVMDASATNSCSGWEPNTDSTADASSGYSLKWPTTTDLRGTFFDFGDVIPLDWLTDHSSDILARLAPNGNPAAPDFRTAFYLMDRPIGSETFLRLKNAVQRPLIASGSTPVGLSMRSFRQWWSGCATGACSTGWASIAQAQDPDWLCRRQYLIVLSDGDDTCGTTADACTQASELLAFYGIKTYTVGFGAAASVGAPGNKLACMAANGGTSAPYTPYLRQDLESTLTQILNDIKAGI